MKMNITTLVGAGAIAATFLFGGSAIAESMPTADAKPPKPAPADPYKTCISGGGTVKKCCEQVGGTYTETEVTAPNPTGSGTIIVGIKKSCAYSVAESTTVDPGPVTTGGGGVFQHVTPGTLAPLTRG
jgi:hypothetical protein